MTMELQEEVVIVGAGIAGLATALALKRLGIRSLVLERAAELRSAGAALSLFPNAWRALDALGVAPKLDAIYRPVETGWVTNLDSGAVQKISYSGTKQRMAGVRGLHRKALLDVLAEELAPGTIRFSSKLASIKTEDSSTATILELEDGTAIKAKVVIGCDGVHSVVAQWLGLTAPVDSGRSAIRGLAVFPRGHGFNHECTSSEKDAGARGDPEALRREVLDNISKGFPPEYLKVVSNADLSTVSWAPLLYRVPWDLIFGRTHKGSVAVAGDAFHPMTPDLGQGGGAALEDAIVLARNIAGMLDAAGTIDVERVGKGIEGYVKERRWRAAGLILGAYLAGWVQQGGRPGLLGWAVKWFRDRVFFKFVQPRIMDSVQYDCGTLAPSAV